ncbi:acyltransferase family protein [Acetobacter sp.]|uniref:acyltransferase family protein n=1 Tax=Acetobacter sp. TaxID=440 RepID=UPI0039ED52DD
MSGKPDQGSSLKSKGLFIPALTGIRGVAALWVVVHHCSGWISQSLGMRNFETASLVLNGFRAVDLFFILSGLILMLTHGEEFGARHSGNIKRFYILRMVRVYPLNTLILLAMVPFVLSQPDFVHWMRLYSTPAQAYKIHNLSWPGFFQSLFLVQTWTVLKLGEWNGPSWSLSAEVLGYLAFPFLAYRLLHVRNLVMLYTIAMGALGAEVLVLAVTHHLHDNPTGTMGALRMAGGFTGGMALGRALTLTRELGVKLPVSPTVAGGMILCATLFVPALAPLMGFGFAWLLFGLAYEQSWLSRVLSAPLVMWWGRISFPFYLVHLILLKILVWSFLPDIHQNGVWVCFLYWSSYVAVTSSLAWVLHQWVERPSHRLAKRLAGPPGKGSVMASDEMRSLSAA